MSPMFSIFHIFTGLVYRKCYFENIRKMKCDLLLLVHMSSVFCGYRELMHVVFVQYLEVKV